MKVIQLFSRFFRYKLRIILGVYLFLLISIPLGAYLASQNTSIKSKALEDTKTKTVTGSPVPISSPKSDVQSEQSGSEGSETTLPTSFGPTLNLKVVLEGRPINNQKDKLFVGIIEGRSVVINPKFLLSFTVDLPATGEYTGLSLAGLSSGNTYSAILKGSAQVATQSAFVMNPTTTNLNSGEAILLTTGDLNEDNTINTSDYSIIQRASGSTPSSKEWNEAADFNKDGIVNSFDLSIVTKNFGKIGDSGPWTSPIPKEATKSGGLITPPSSGGYWLWMPQF